MSIELGILNAQIANIIDYVIASDYISENTRSCLYIILVNIRYGVRRYKKSETARHLTNAFNLLYTYADEEVVIYVSESIKKACERNHSKIV